MKYIHFDVTAIREFIVEKNLTITRISLDGRSAEGSFSPEDLGDMLDKSNKLWGTRLDYFFLVASNRGGENSDLKESVRKVEAGELNGFILVAYQDGGLISVSKETYPFQKDAESAAWWYVR